MVLFSVLMFPIIHYFSGPQLLQLGGRLGWGGQDSLPQSLFSVCESFRHGEEKPWGGGGAILCSFRLTWGCLMLQKRFRSCASSLSESAKLSRLHPSYSASALIALLLEHREQGGLAARLWRGGRERGELGHARAAPLAQGRREAFGSLLAWVELRAHTSPPLAWPCSE